MKMKTATAISILIICSIFASGCKKAENAPTTPNTSVSTSDSQKTIPTNSAAIADEKDAVRKVDFKNFTQPDIACNVGEEPQEPENITVKNGEYRREGSDFLYFNVQDAYYGDLDGDGKEEAAVPTVCNLGGSGNFGSTLVYTMRGNKPTLLTHCDYMNEIKIEKGLITGVVYDRFFKVFGKFQAFLLVGSKLVETSPSESGQTKTESDGRLRIEFAPGRTLAVLKGSIKIGDNKRYVLRAKKGQMLSIDFKPDGEEVDDTKKLIEVAGAEQDDPSKYQLGTKHFNLPQNGDYEIRLLPQSETPKPYTLVIDIR